MAWSAACNTLHSLMYTSPVALQNFTVKLATFPYCCYLVYLLQVAMEKGLSPQQAAQALTEEALSAHSVTPATRDNITVLVVQFAPMPTSSA